MSNIVPIRPTSLFRALDKLANDADQLARNIKSCGMRSGGTSRRSAQESQSIPNCSPTRKRRR